MMHQGSDRQNDHSPLVRTKFEMQGVGSHLKILTRGLKQSKCNFLAVARGLTRTWSCSRESTGLRPPGPGSKWLWRTSTCLQTLAKLPRENDKTLDINSASFDGQYR